MDSKESTSLLELAQRNATSAWRNDLRELLERADDTFGDIIWELPASYTPSETHNHSFVYGHKGQLFVFITSLPFFAD